MTTPRKSRRAVMAALLLTGSPRAVQHLGAESEAFIDVEFDSAVDLFAWLAAAGQDETEVATSEHTTTTPSRRYRRSYAVTTWHGWRICALARDDIVDPPPLDAATRDGLTTLAGVAG